MGPNILKKIDIFTCYCNYCHDSIRAFSRDRLIRHFYDHEYPNWRQPSSIENDPSFEEYKSKFAYMVYEKD
jgi:hypothetical protein